MNHIAIYNRIVLKKKYDWFIGINIIFLEKNDFGIQRPKLAGVLKVDEDWFGEQWRKFYYSTPVPNPNQEDVSIGDIVGGSQVLDLSETIFKATVSRINSNTKEVAIVIYSMHVTVRSTNCNTVLKIFWI